MDDGSHSRENSGGAAQWLVRAFGVVLVLFGLALGAGGLWLLALGGSWYYLPAGLLLIVSGALLIGGSRAGVWVYVAYFLFTLLWAFDEVGLDWWAQVPRLVAPIVLLILALLCLPALSGGGARRERRWAGAATAVLLLALGTNLLVHAVSPSAVQAQDDTDQARSTPAQADPKDLASTAGGPGTIPDRPAGEQAPAPARTMPMLEAGEDWPAYGGSYHGTRYSPLDQITAENVDTLQQLWTYRTGDMPAEGEEGDDYAPETTPLVIDGNMYLCSAMDILISLDAVTGRERWRHDPGVSKDAIPYSATCRGVSYYAIPGRRPTEPCATRILAGTLDARLIAVDAQTGQGCAGFGDNGEVNLLEGLGESVPGFVSVTSPPTIIRGVAVVGHQVLDNQKLDAPSGVVRGYDAVTGELLWAWDMLKPELKGLPPEGETYSRGTPNMWTVAAGDEELGLVYLPLGNAAGDYWGAERTATENEYSTSVVALDARTGEEAWHFQTVHYDLWDYDLGSQPTLVDFPTDQGPVPALILTSKQGEIYVLDRATGEPLTGVEEREVPRGGVAGERLSPTQPFSAYHTLRQPPITEEDMWGMSPLDQLWCRIQFRRASYEGPYTPPTTEGHWIEYPSYNGGSDWGGIAVDQERGIIVANYNDMPNFNRLVPREEVEQAGVVPIDRRLGEDPDAPNDLSPMAGAPYGIDVNAGWRLGFTGLLCKQPPYGGIRAIDLATGETLWDRPLGEARANGPFGIPSMLPLDIGTPNNGGAVITAGGLVFIAAATDNLFRAIDIETGETLWQTELPAGGQATPISYEVDGRQYITLMAGGHHFMETPIGDYFLTWTLPENRGG